VVLCLTVSGGSLTRPRQPSSGPEPEALLALSVGGEGGLSGVLRAPPTRPAAPVVQQPPPSPRAPRSMPARVCTRLSLVRAVPSCVPISAAAPPLRLQGCKRFCTSLFSS
jgi:hypothetical protein